MEIDIVAESDGGRVIVVEVKKTQEKIALSAIEDFQEKIEVYRQQVADKIILPAFLSLGGFFDTVLQRADELGIATASEIKQF